jgi:hypothetical protein
LEKKTIRKVPSKRKASRELVRFISGNFKHTYKTMMATVQTYILTPAECGFEEFPKFIEVMLSFGCGIGTPMDEELAE